MDSIIDNLEKVKNEIKISAEKIGKKQEDITLIAVTKTKPIEVLRKIISLGVVDLGENRVQELREKMDAIKEDVRWHMIGHLQKNKVKYIIDGIYMIHSVDSIELAIEIDKRAKLIHKIVKILVQLNISKEESKFGISLENLEVFLEKCSALENIRVCGFMTMAPYIANEADIRAIFSKMYQLVVDIKEKNIDNVYIEYLSMGMSNDFKIAIDEGSNMVRIGSSLFGPR